MAIDDFGTGHSSLAYLKQFPVHEVKVDRAFIQGVAESQVDLAIVRAIIDLAHAMGISAVAEGVETKDQAAELNMLGCPVGRASTSLSHFPLRSSASCSSATSLGLRTERPVLINKDA